VLGDYAVTLSAGALMVSKNGGDAERASPVMASLCGVRLAVASEAKTGQEFDVGLVKNLTGDRRMTARKLFEDVITFDITSKLVLMTNVRPVIDHMDAAIRGRLHLWPFDRQWNRPGDIEHDSKLPDGDPKLAEALREEKTGILAWLVRGAVLYVQEGLKPTSEVLAITRDYVMSQDPLGEWLEGYEPCGAQEGTLAQELFDDFSSWCFTAGASRPYETSKAFGLALDSRQIEGKRSNLGAKRGLRRKVAEVSYETHVQPLIHAAVLVAKPQVMQLFKDYGVRNAKDIKPESYAEVIAKLQAIKAGAAAAYEFEDRMTDDDLA
jgi:phage/plasmid-associated DNA primase